MRRIIMGFVATSVLALASASVASAADIPVKASYAPPAWSWTGFYLGAHVGSGFGTVESEIPGGGFALSSHNYNGFLGGGQIGFNWQTGPIVIGVEADASATSLKGTAPCVVGFLVCKTNVNWLSTFTGRLGFTADKALIYVKGGAAWASFDSSASIAGFNIATASDYSQWGATIGAGVEYAFAPGWSAKIEYDYINFGKHSVAFTTGGLGGGFGGAGTTNIDVTQNVHLVKFGVNYRFGSSAISAYN
jgi:outer membrane immunogenic protein